MGLGGARKDNKDVSNAVRNVAGEIAALRHELDRTTLIVQSMYEIMKSKMGLSEEAMMEMIESVDMLDGKLDGKPSRIPENCPECTRPVSVQTNTCFFCGISVERRKVF